MRELLETLVSMRFGGEILKITIDIPKEYENDFIGDKFNDFFSRVITDINCDGMCGLYEKEIAEMLLDAFGKAEILVQM